MKKLLALLLLVLFLSYNLFADSEAPDIRISDNDSDVLNINSDGTIPIDPTSPLTIDTLTVSTALNYSACGLLKIPYSAGFSLTLTCDDGLEYTPGAGSLSGGLFRPSEIDTNGIITGYLNAGDVDDYLKLAVGTGLLANVPQINIVGGANAYVSSDTTTTNLNIGTSPTNNLILQSNHSANVKISANSTTGNFTISTNNSNIDFDSNNLLNILSVVTGSIQSDSIVNDTGLAAGVYTPTRSAEVNLDANVTMTEAQYMRVGNTATVSGRFTADPTLTATATSFEITLPVASNIGAVEDVAGVAFCGSIAGQGAEVIGVAANNTAKIQWISTDVTSQSWSFTFSYQVI